MRGDLDETLARMARREEALRRAGTEPVPGRNARPLPEAATGAAATNRPVLAGATGANRPAVAGFGGASETRTDRVEGAREAIRASVPVPVSEPGGDGRAAGTPVVATDPVQAIAEAVRRVVAEHPGLTVTLRVEHGGQAYPLRVAWSAGSPTVRAEAEVVPPPVWPMPVRPVPTSNSDEAGVGDPAARLAEMIRRDPSLLHGDGTL
jgi:hypothetical protein